ncbi:MAG: hypothetical protein J6C49_03270 [Elusimicrobiaceae bacterium]|nr:hypothetical protein [Elusimicrobiaceae bacterium]
MSAGFSPSQPVFFVHVPVQSLQSHAPSLQTALRVCVPVYPVPHSRLSEAGLAVQLLSQALYSQFPVDVLHVAVRCSVPHPLVHARTVTAVPVQLFGSGSAGVTVPAQLSGDGSYVKPLQLG